MSNYKLAVLKAVSENNGQLKSANIAKILCLHPQKVSRILVSFECEKEKYLYEDDNGFIYQFNTSLEV